MATSAMREWISLWQRVPFATSIPEALALYYAAQEKRVEFDFGFENCFHIITDAELKIIYGEALTAALKAAICGLPDISKSKTQSFSAEIPSIVNHILPQIITSFRAQDANIGLYEIHRQLILVVIKSFAMSPFLATCTADFPSLLAKCFREKLHNIDVIFSDMCEPESLEAYGFECSGYDGGDYFVNIYKKIRRFTPDTKVALPEWPVSMQSVEELKAAETQHHEPNAEIESIIAFTQPGYVLQLFEKDFTQDTKVALPEWPVSMQSVAEELKAAETQHHEPNVEIESIIAFTRPDYVLQLFEKDFTQYCRRTNFVDNAVASISNHFSNTFSTKFSISVEAYAVMLADSSVNVPPEQRSKLCKSNSLIRLSYEQTVKTLGLLLADAQFTRYLATQPAEQIEWLTNAKENFTHKVYDQISGRMTNGNDLSANFIWPERRRALTLTSRP